MFQKTTFAFLLVTALMTSAKQLSPQEIRERLQLNSDIYVLDSTGKKIVSGPGKTNYWRSGQSTGTIESNWSSKSELGMIAIRHNWQVQDDGTIKVSIKEFKGFADKNEDDYKDLLDQKDFVLENFEPVVWKVKNINSHNVIVRFIPSLRDISTPIAIDSLPIAGTGILITDNNGYLWAEDLEFNGKYSGLTSHRGTLAISYVPFTGAKELGFAEGNQITINIDKKLQINLKSATAFLPAGVIAKVYAIYQPNKKSKGFNSTHSFDSSKEERIQEVLKQ